MDTTPDVETARGQYPGEGWTWAFPVHPLCMPTQTHLSTSVGAEPLSGVNGRRIEAQLLNISSLTNVLKGSMNE
jgi:hypothetical protein